MKIRKTRQDKRATYRYETYLEDGTRQYIELKPGENGVTEAWIKLLHAMDDHEVYENCKCGHPPLTKEEKALKKEWEESHPGEKYLGNWNLSLDYLADEEDNSADKSLLLKDNNYSLEEEVPWEVQRLREVEELLTDKQKQVYRLHELDGWSFTDIAKLMDTSVANVTKHYKKAIQYIKQNF